MNTMDTNTTSRYTNLSDFLTHHKTSDSVSGQCTHTRIGNLENLENNDLKIYPGSFSIPDEELSTFYRLYYEHIFVKERKEYLTEKQLDNNGPLVVDFDFRYDVSVTTRQHTEEHIQDIVCLYLETLKEMLVFEENKQFPIFIMEKPTVNRVVKDVAKDNVTKDGIHMIIGIQVDRTIQIMVRDRILEQIGDIWELPLTNTWDKVLDEGISKGCVNWQMYGSQKPRCDVYKLTYYTVAELEPKDNSFITSAKSVKEFNSNLHKNLPLLSVQYNNHIKFEINPNIKEEYNKRVSMAQSKTKKLAKKSKINLTNEREENMFEDDIQIEDIVNLEILTKAVDNLIKDLKPNEYYIKEIHDYTQILPKKYYEPGSHLLNRQVAFALKHTDNRLFLSWVMLRAKADDFNYDTIPELYDTWKKHFHKREDGVTKRSIMYWAKQDAPEEYEKVRASNIYHYIDDTLAEAGDWDYAMVLFHMYKDKYVCGSITNKKWYTFNNHRWEKDEGQKLRMSISTDLYNHYSARQSQLLLEMQKENNQENRELTQKKLKKIGEIMSKLKKTNDKNNIMREAMEIFFDKEFIKNMDANPYLMCFTNGVFDFKTKTFRDGYPQDYITKTTGIPYVKLGENDGISTKQEIKTFMSQLFPQETLCRYMWDHLASTLIGIKKEHVFNIYRGSGSNGKSILTDLMSQALGEYKGTVPITLVTEKRGSIGGTSSEIIQLKGIRYAVMQEPSKDAVINEGIMKELTGGDPLQARALYSDSEIFIPQFSLVVCTNSLFEIKSNDDGTWRRMKLVDYLSKFVSEGETYTDTTKYIFPKDKTLKEKLPKWATVFMSMLVDRACETEGEVKDCPEVLLASNGYRQSQDSITAFINEKIVVDATGSIGKKMLSSMFEEWYKMNFNGRRAPKLIEVEEAMKNKFGNRNSKTNKWHGIRFASEETITDDIDELGNM